MRYVALLVSVASLGSGATFAADEDTAPAPVELERLKAYQAVREGNRRLLEGHPNEALEAYTHAETQRPDAREIAFVKGLAHYRLDQFDEAREAFQKAENFADDDLAEDALYSLGTCDHTEALETLEDPQLALSLLEDAMRRYHDVLARQPDHHAARDANRKAASMWQELKRQLEQQPQPQNSDQERDDGEEQQGDKQQQQDQDQAQQDENEQQQEREQQQAQDEKNEQQQAESSEQEEQQQAKATEKEEQVSREQAQRKLRELMQAQRERKKRRREPVQVVPVRPVEKDW